MAISSSTLTIGSAEIGSGGGGSRWDTGAAPIRYPDPNIKILDPRFAKYTLPMAAVERIAGGCRFTEGPVWFGDGRYLLWSDIPNDRIMRWDRRGQRVPQAVQLRQWQHAGPPRAARHLRDGCAAADPHRI